MLPSIRKPNFVLCDHLSGMRITAHLERHSLIAQSTALHRSKDFAVSPVCFHTIIPEGTRAFRHWRHCSHLLACARRALPATLLPTNRAVFGLSSPGLAPQSDHSIEEQNQYTRYVTKTQLERLNKGKSSMVRYHLTIIPNMIQYLRMKYIAQYISKTTKLLAVAFGAIVLLATTHSAFAASPLMITGSASLTSQNTITLTGNFTVQSPQTPPVQVRFEYGTTPALGSATNYQTFNTTSGTYTDTISIAQGQTYYFRAMGMVNGALPGYGQTVTYTAQTYGAPTVNTYSATIGTYNVTFNGYYNGNGTATTTYFEYANNSSFIGAQETPWITNSATSGSMTDSSVSLSALSPNTTYYVEAVAENAGGTTYGNAIPFTTTYNGNNNGSCVVNSFGNSTNINAGSGATLTWNTSNCSTVSISGVGSVASTGSIVVYPTVTTTYTLSINGNTSNSVVITVNGYNNGSCTINSFVPSTTSVASGGTVELTWSTSNCTNVTVSGGGVTSNQISGSAWSTSLYGTTTFYITADNQSTQATVYINGNNYNGTQCQVSSFYASPTSVNSGSTAYLYWNMSNCNYVTISGPGLSGGTYYGNSVTTNPIYTSGTYYLTAYGNNGNASANTYVTVNTVPIYNYNNNYYSGACQITSFYASPSQVSAGNATMLYWNTTNCSSVSISGGTLSNYGNAQSLSGSITTGALYGSTTYTLSAYGNNGNQQQSATVTTFPVSTIPTTTYTQPTYTSPAQTIIRYITEGVTPSTNNSGSVNVGSTVENMQGSSAVGSNLAGLALWGNGIIPNSLIGILFIILLIMAILVIARNLYSGNDNGGHGGGHH